MFIPKGDAVNATDLSGRPVTYQWNETMFWNVFYVKGAFLDADKAFEVMNGCRTLDLRMLRKATTTAVLTQFLASHPKIGVHSHALEHNENAPLRKRILKLGFPAPLFTIDFEGAGLDRATFTRFFDSLEPAFGLQVSLGQCNTVVLCPALTSHSEMSEAELRAAGIAPTTIRVAVGDEAARHLIAHFIRAAELVIEPVHPGFCAGFMAPATVDELVERTFVDFSTRWLRSQPRMEELLR
jgi:O-acetylhomoserine/O-acetylserine sulfhydrylase-like pyridoxal-dependent enzyme